MIVPPRFVVIWIAIIIGMFFSLKRGIMKRIGVQSIPKHQKRLKTTSVEEISNKEEVSGSDEEKTKLKSDF